MSKKRIRGVSTVIVRTPSGRTAGAEAPTVAEAMATAQKIARMPAAKRRHDGHAVSEGTREVDGATIIMMCGKKYRLTESELVARATLPQEEKERLDCPKCIDLEQD